MMLDLFGLFVRRALQTTVLMGCMFAAQSCKQSIPTPASICPGWYCLVWTDTIEGQQVEGAVCGSTQAELDSLKATTLAVHPNAKEIRR